MQSTGGPGEDIPKPKKTLDKPRLYASGVDLLSIASTGG